MSEEIMCSKCGKMPKLADSDLCYDCTHEGEKDVVRVKVDRSAENERLVDENADLRAKLDTIAQAEFEKRKNALPSKYRDLVKEPSQLEMAEKLAKESPNYDAPSGSAPLPSSANQNPMAFEDYRSMMAYLRDREAKGDKEAKAKIDALFLKFVREAKKNPDILRKAEGSGENIKESD